MLLLWLGRGCCFPYSQGEREREREREKQGNKARERKRKRGRQKGGGYVIQIRVKGVFGTSVKQQVHKVGKERTGKDSKTG